MAAQPSKAVDRLGGAAVWVAAALLAAPPFIQPIFNSDLFWHLSAGARILRDRALPPGAVDSLFRPPTGWIDFEWLSQVVYQAIYAAAGMRGLWALKVLVLAACAWPALAALRRRGVPAEFRAAALAVWAAGALFFADLRPELFSVALFGASLAALEAWRARGFALTAVEYAGTAAAFALWANLHGGFVCGLAAFACYLAVELARRRWAAARALGAALACAAVATLANPYGLGPHRVLLEHARQAPYLARHLAEWQPFAFRRELPLQPLAALALAGAALACAVVARGGRRFARLPLGLGLCAAVFGLAAWRHMRMAAFFDTPAVLFIVIAAHEADWLRTRAARAALLAALALDCAFVAYYAPRLPRGLPFDASQTPVAAASFLESERPAVEGLRMYAEWDWEGFLAWRLQPWFRVLMDGRYVFHDRLGPVDGALAAGPEAWGRLLRGWGLDAALMRRADARYPRIVLADGRPWTRPWHELYMPRRDWALVYEDEQAVLFIRRDACPARWLRAHEIARRDPPGRTPGTAAR